MFNKLKFYIQKNAIPQHILLVYQVFFIFVLFSAIHYLSLTVFGLQVHD